MLSLDTVMTKRIIPRSSCSVRLDIGLWSLVFCCLRTVKFKVGIDLPAPRSKLHVDHPIYISRITMAEESEPHEHGHPTEGLCCLCTMEDITDEDQNYGEIITFSKTYMLTTDLFHIHRCTIAVALNSFTMFDSCIPSLFNIIKSNISHIHPWNGSQPTLNYAL